MEISDFTIRLIFLLIPGAIACLIIEAIGVHKKWTQFRFIINAVLLGVFSFGLLKAWYLVFGKTFTTWDCIFKKAELNYVELLWCIPISIFLGYIVGGAIQYKLINRLAQFLHISKKYGDDSLFMYYLATQDWVYVRDKDKGLTYRGRVDKFSEDEHSKELALYDVTVFDYQNSAELDKIPNLYLNFNDRDIVIESCPGNLN